MVASAAHAALTLIRDDHFRGAFTDSSGNLADSGGESGDSGWSSDTGNDILNGGTGNDILVGGRGSDTLNGGTGSIRRCSATPRSQSLFAWGDDTLRISTGADTDQARRDRTFSSPTGRSRWILRATPGGRCSPRRLRRTEGRCMAVRGRILTFFDDGESMLSLCQKAIDLQLVPAGDAELATLIYRNVLEQPADGGRYPGAGRLYRGARPGRFPRLHRRWPPASISTSTGYNKVGSSTYEILRT